MRSEGSVLRFQAQPQEFHPTEIYRPDPETCDLLDFTQKGTPIPLGGRIVKYLDRCGYRYDNGSFYIFNGRYYEKVSEDDLSREITESVAFHPRNILLSRNFKKDVISQVKDSCPVFGRDDVPDSFMEDPRYDGWLIPFENGIYNVERDELVPFSPYIFFNRILHARYVPNDQHPVEEIYRSIFPDDATRDFFYLAVGYTLYSHTLNPPALFVLLGPGETGKSAILHTLKTILGPDVTTSLDPVQLSTQFAVVELRNKVANLCTEAAMVRSWGKGNVDGNILKKLSSGETYSIDRKGTSRVDFTNEAKMWFAANDMPNFGDSSSGMMRRVHILPCLERQDSSMMIYDLMCAPEALSWLAFKALKAYVLFRMEGRMEFVDPPQMKRFSEEFSTQDSLMDFLSSIHEDINDRSGIADKLNGKLTSELYDEYKEYVLDSGRTNPLGRRSFTNRICLEYNLTMLKESYRKDGSGSVSSRNRFVKR